MSILAQGLTLALTLAQKRAKAPGTVYAYPNGMGGWCAEVTLPQPLSKDDFAAQLSQLEVTVRALILEEITRRESCWAQKTYPAQALAQNKIHLQSDIEDLILVQEQTNSEGLLTTVVFCQ